MSQDRNGKPVPQVTFRTRQDHEWVNLSSDDVFKGKTVIVFLSAGSLHADLFFHPRSSLQPAGSRIPQAWC